LSADQSKSSARSSSSQFACASSAQRLDAEPAATAKPSSQKARMARRVVLRTHAESPRARTRGCAALKLPQRNWPPLSGALSLPLPLLS
jgi:hypothetical protein